MAGMPSYRREKPAQSNHILNIIPVRRVFVNTRVINHKRIVCVRHSCAIRSPLARTDCPFHPGTRVSPSAASCEPYYGRIVKHAAHNTTTILPHRFDDLCAPAFVQCVCVFATHNSSSDFLNAIQNKFVSSSLVGSTCGDFISNSMVTSSPASLHQRRSCASVASIP